MKNFFGRFLAVTVACLILCGSNLTAQTWQEYRQQENEQFKKFKQEEEAGMAKMRAEFNRYVDQRDKEFAEFLKGNWKPFKIEDSEEQPVKPKPRVVPEFIAAPPAPRENTKPIKVSPIVSSSTIPTAISLPRPPVRRVVSPVANAVPATFNFYGVPVYLEYDHAFEVPIKESGQKAIASYWENASSTRYPSLIDKLMMQKELLNLNDFAYYLMVKKFAEIIYPTNETGQTLATWFIMVRSGYGMRLATSGSSIVLLMPTSSVIYGKGYVTSQGLNYYILNDVGGAQLQTYDRDYANASRPINFAIESPVDLGGNTVSRTLKFNFKEKSYQLIVSFDRGLVDMYKDFPQLGMEVYFNAAVSLQVKESVAASLKPLMVGMDEAESVGFLLSFVQLAFDYKTDPEQFGREKFFFADEVFFYPFCDCEDRSVLFSYLVRELTGLQVVGLEYPNHMATAVALNKPVGGDYVEFGSRKFVIADPTYIGAPLGRTMPGFEGTFPTIIPMHNVRGNEIAATSLWDLATKGGCYQGSNLHNAVVLSDGSGLMTGYYSGSATFGGVSLVSTENTNACFVGKMSSSGTARWVKSIKATGNAIGLSVTEGDKGLVYIAGSFRGTLAIDGNSLSTHNNHPDAFVASFTGSGELLWVKKLNLDTIPDTAPVAFSASFAANGKPIGMLKTEVCDEFVDYGVYTGKSGEVVYNGIINQVFASTVAQSSFASGVVAASPEMLKSESDLLIADQTDRSVAGLFAAINLVRNAGAVLSGSDAQAALDRFNPKFKSRSPAIYKNIGKISFVNSSNGIVSITTANNNDIMFDKIKVKNKAKISITELSGGDVRFDVLSGIMVGKMIVWYNLNYIKLNKINGDMLFDYDSDHSQQRINMRKDILK